MSITTAKPRRDFNHRSVSTCLYHEQNTIRPLHFGVTDAIVQSYYKTLYVATWIVVPIINSHDSNVAWYWCEFISRQTNWLARQSLPWAASHIAASSFLPIDLQIAPFRAATALKVDMSARHGAHRCLGATRCLSILRAFVDSTERKKQIILLSLSFSLSFYIDIYLQCLRAILS
jgi:hypothetical protein